MASQAVAYVTSQASPTSSSASHGIETSHLSTRSHRSSVPEYGSPGTSLAVLHHPIPVASSVHFIQTAPQEVPNEFAAQKSLQSFQRHDGTDLDMSAVQLLQSSPHPLRHELPSRSHQLSMYTTTYHSDEENGIYEMQHLGPDDASSQYGTTTVSQGDLQGDSNNASWQAPQLRIQPPTPAHPNFDRTHRPHDSYAPNPHPGVSVVPEPLSWLPRTMYSDGEYQPNNMSMYNMMPRSTPMYPRGQSIYSPYIDPTFVEDDEYISSSRSSTPADDGPSIKRPLNSFMLYRRDKQHIVNTNNHQSVSRIVAAMWKAESADVKKKYHDAARELAEQHKTMYPAYKYTPKKRGIYDKKPIKRTMSSSAIGKRERDERRELQRLKKHLRATSTGIRDMELPESLPPPKSLSRASNRSKSRDSTAVSDIILGPLRNSESPGRQNSYELRFEPEHEGFTAASSTPIIPQYDHNSIQTSTVATPLDEDLAHGSGELDMIIQTHYEPYFGEIPRTPCTDMHRSCTLDSIESHDTSDEQQNNYCPVEQLIVSPRPYYEIDQYNVPFFLTHEDIEIFRMGSPMANEMGIRPHFSMHQFTLHHMDNIYWEKEHGQMTVDPRVLYGTHVPED